MGDRKFDNKVHSYGLPRSSRNVERMKKSERVVVRVFDARTNITCCNVVLNIGVHSWPGIVTRE